MARFSVSLQAQDTRVETEKPLLCMVLPGRNTYLSLFLVCYLPELCVSARYLRFKRVMNASCAAVQTVVGDQVFTIFLFGVTLK